MAGDCLLNNMRLKLFIVIAVTVVLGFSTSVIYGKTRIKEKKIENVEYNNEYHIVNVRSRSIVMDENSVRKEFNFILDEKATKKDAENLKIKLNDFYKDDNTFYSVEKENDNYNVKYIFNCKNLKKLNISLKNAMGDYNTLDYKYVKNSGYRGHSGFKEDTNPQNLLTYLGYDGKIVYQLYGYNNEVMKNLVVNGVDMGDVTVKYVNEIATAAEIIYDGEYFNYWPLEKKVEQGAFVILFLWFSGMLYKAALHTHNYVLE